MVGHCSSHRSALGAVSDPTDPSYKVSITVHLNTILSNFCRDVKILGLIILMHYLSCDALLRSIWDKISLALRDSPLAIEPLFGGACQSQACVGVRVMGGACVCAQAS